MAACLPGGPATNTCLLSMLQLALHSFTPYLHAPLPTTQVLCLLSRGDAWGAAGGAAHCTDAQCGGQHG